MGDSWSDRVQILIDGAAHPAPLLKSYREANADFIRNALTGQGPHAARPDPRFGARVVFNISSAHVPALIAAGDRSARPYQNRYDCERRLGKAPKSRLTVRQRVDAAVVTATSAIAGASLRPEDLYYGAVELNGAGVRFFGDFCLVRRPETIDDATPVLIRNSYDLTCRPVADRVGVGARFDAREAEDCIRQWAGSWSSDTATMAVCKILDDGRQTSRRLTMGMVSAGLLEDEDYIEAVTVGSFGHAEIAEIRSSAADAAAEARIADRTLSGPPGGLADLLWRHRRRAAERAARDVALKVRVVVTAGRDRG